MINEGSNQDLRDDELAEPHFISSPAPTVGEATGGAGAGETGPAGP